MKTTTRRQLKKNQPKKTRRFVWIGDVVYLCDGDDIHENPDWLIGSN